nr:hypothetical protein [Roseovarius sp. SCSIO 43702]
MGVDLAGKGQRVITHPRQQTGRESDAKAGQEADAQCPLRLICELLTECIHAIERLLQLMTLGEDQICFVGRNQPLFYPIEKLEPELRFRMFERLAERWLGRVQLARGRTDRAAAVNRVEYLDLSKIHLAIVFPVTDSVMSHGTPFIFRLSRALSRSRATLSLKHASRPSRGGSDIHVAPVSTSR